MVTSAELEALMQGVHTGHQARICLGTALRLIGHGYAFAEVMSNAAGEADAARRLLDGARDYAERIYRTIPASDDVLPDQVRRPVALALGQADEAVRIVQAETGGGWAVDFLGEIGAALNSNLRLIGDMLAGGAEGALNLVGGGLGELIKSLWWLLLLAAVVYARRRRAT